jgi:predicted acyltransferase
MLKGNYKLFINLIQLERSLALREFSLLYEGPGQKYGEYSVVPCKALYLHGTLLAEQLRRSGPITQPPYRLL